MTSQKTTFLLSLCLLIIGLFGLTACQDSAIVDKDAPTQAEATEKMKKNSPSPSGNSPQSAVYFADLNALNSSGVQGRAKIFVRNGEVAALVNAQGHVPRQIHAQHIHGFLDGSVSTCPTLAGADDNEDGFISAGEGGPSYGPILVPLDGSLDVAEGLGDPATFPTADNEAGAITYRETVSTGDLAVNGGGGLSVLTLENHAVVLHGTFVDGEYELTAPVACGTLSLVNNPTR